MKDTMNQIFGRFEFYLRKLAGHFQYDEYQPNNCSKKSEFTNKINNFLVSSCDRYKGICDRIIDIFGKKIHYNTINDNLATFFKHNPSGSSVKNLMHLVQLMNKPKPIFSKFDYGLKENLERYQSTDPLQWDLERIKIDVVLVSGQDDQMST